MSKNLNSSEKRILVQATKFIEAGQDGIAAKLLKVVLGKDESEDPGINPSTYEDIREQEEGLMDMLAPENEPSGETSKAQRVASGVVGENGYCAERTADVVKQDMGGDAPSGLAQRIIAVPKELQDADRNFGNSADEAALLDVATYLANQNSSTVAQEAARLLTTLLEEQTVSENLGEDSVPGKPYQEEADRDLFEDMGIPENYNKNKSQKVLASLFEKLTVRGIKELYDMPQEARAEFLEQEGIDPEAWETPAQRTSAASYSTLEEYLKASTMDIIERMATSSDPFESLLKAGLPEEEAAKWKSSKRSSRSRSSRRRIITGGVGQYKTVNDFLTNAPMSEIEQAYKNPKMLESIDDPDGLQKWESNIKGHRSQRASASQYSTLNDYLKKESMDTIERMANSSDPFENLLKAGLPEEEAAKWKTGNRTQACEDCGNPELIHRINKLRKVVTARSRVQATNIKELFKAAPVIELEKFVKDPDSLEAKGISPEEIAEFKSTIQKHRTSSCDQDDIDVDVARAKARVHARLAKRNK